MNRHTVQTVKSKGVNMRGEQLEDKTPGDGPFYEVLTAEELAERWRVPATWVREQTRSRCADPIPHIRLGRYVRFSFGSPELTRWWMCRQSGRTHSA
jgi:hypothetical protein